MRTQQGTPAATTKLAACWAPADSTKTQVHAAGDSIAHSHEEYAMQHYEILLCSSMHSAKFFGGPFYVVHPGMRRTARGGARPLRPGTKR